jgi:hypothetical protein
VGVHVCVATAHVFFEREINVMAGLANFASGMHTLKQLPRVMRVQWAIAFFARVV